MLETLIRPDIATSGPLLESQLQADGKQWQSAGTVTLIGEDIPLTAEADNCPSEETAQQQVALQLLHAYQTRLLQLFPTCTHLFLIISMIASRTSRNSQQQDKEWLSNKSSILVIADSCQ